MPEEHRCSPSRLARPLPPSCARTSLRIGYDVSVGDFEVVEIAAGEADAVFSATAYHWISQEAQTNRPAAILRPGGLVAIVDLIQVDSPEDAGFFAAAQPIYERYGEGHSGPPAHSRGRFDPRIRAVLDADRRFDRVEVYHFDWDQTYSASDYRNLIALVLRHSDDGRV